MPSTTSSSSSSIRFNFITTLRQPSVWVMGLLGFSAGLPILLIFSSLSIWLREAGLDKSVVTMFSWAALGYSFKFVWAPLVDRLPLPLLKTWMGQRRSWLLLSQCLIVVAINAMAWVNPAEQGNTLIFMALAAVLLGFSSASQDIVIDAYRIEIGNKSEQGMLSASYAAGYRIGMIVAGAGTLYVADYLGTALGNYHYQAWRSTYGLMSLFCLVGIITTLCIKEPLASLEQAKRRNDSTADYASVFAVFIALVISFIATFNSIDYLLELMIPFIDISSPILSFIFEVARLLFSVLTCLLLAFLLARIGLINTNFFWEGYCHPVIAFFDEHGKQSAWLILCFIAFFRSSDIVLGVISNVFYTDMGFSKTDIGNAVKTFGVLVTILGGFIGGYLCIRLGIMRMLWYSLLVVMLTNLLFILLFFNQNPFMLYSVVAADNLAGGLATTAFIAFLSSLVDLRFTAMQYAIFSSLMTLLPKLLGGYSGTIVEQLGYVEFFTFSSLICLPVMVLLIFMRRHFDIRE